jgi:hypothetical protein
MKADSTLHRVRPLAWGGTRACATNETDEVGSEEAKQCGKTTRNMLRLRSICDRDAQIFASCNMLLGEGGIYEAPGTSALQTR